MKMNRRKSLAAALAAMSAPVLGAAGTGKAIQLHVDLEVTPGKEATLETNFRKVFEPTISRQPGFVEVKLMKFRKAMMGKEMPGFSYRLLISFRTEEQRLTWVATADHQKAWPTLEAQLKGAKLVVLLYDLV